VRLFGVRASISPFCSHYSQGPCSNHCLDSLFVLLVALPPAVLHPVERGGPLEGGAGLWFGVLRAVPGTLQAGYLHTPQEGRYLPQEVDRV